MNLPRIRLGEKGQSQKVTQCEVKVAQLCPTLCNLMDYTVHGILQAKILEWVAFPFSMGSSQPRDGTRVSCVASRLFYPLSHQEALCLLLNVSQPLLSHLGSSLVGQ